MSVNVSDEIRLEQGYRQAGFQGQLFRRQRAKTYLTAQAKDFLKSQSAFGRLNALVPQGYLYDEGKNTLIKRSDVTDKRGRVQKRWKRKGIVVNKQTKRIVYRGPSTISGTARITFFRNGRYYTREHVFMNMPYSSTRDAEQELKRQLINAVVFSEAEKEYVVSVEIQNTHIVRGGDQALDIGELRLRRFMFRLDSFEDPECDTKQDICVLDALKFRYQDDRFIDKEALEEETIDEIAKEYDNEDWRTEGIKINTLTHFCKTYDIKMILLTDDQKILHYYDPRNNDENIIIDVKGRNYPKPFVGIVRDGHFYLQVDKKVVKSASENLKHISSIKANAFKNDKGEIEDKRPIIYLDVKSKRKTFIANKITEVEEQKSNHEVMLDIMEEKQINVLSANIKFKNGILEEFELDGIRYVFMDEHKHLIREYYEMSGYENLKYKGATVMGIVSGVLKDHVTKQSYFNPNTLALLTQEKSKDLTHVGGSLTDLSLDMHPDLLIELLEERNQQLEDFYNNKKIKTFDIQRCHTYILENPVEQWMYFTPKDEFKKYNGEDIKLGLYFVETDDRLLFMGNKYYPSAFVNKGIEEGLITKDNIKKYMYASDCSDFGLYRDVVRYLKLMEQDPNEEARTHGKVLSKVCCNTISGLLGKDKMTYTQNRVSWDREQMKNFLYGNSMKGKPFYLEFKRDDKSFFHYGYNDVISLERNNLPHYFQILCQQAMMVYDYMKELTNGDFSKVLYRRVDAITIEKPLKCPHLFTGHNGGLRRQDNPLRPVNKPYHNLVMTDEMLEVRWEIAKSSSKEYEQFYDLIDRNQSALINAPAGYGKTFVINKIKEKYQNVILLAPTNVAALRIGGSTLHKEFGMGNDETLIHKKRLLKLQSNPPDCIVVDEMSLMTGDLWMVLNAIKSNVDTSILCFGDFGQLQAIDNGDYKNHSLPAYICDQRMIIFEYHDLCRADPELKVFSENIKLNELDTVCEPLGINIVYTNDYRRKVNKIMNFGAGMKYLDIQPIDNVFDYLLYKGCPFISISNDHEKELYFNGERWICIGFDNQTIRLQSLLREGHAISIMHKVLSEDFDLGYAITCHKAIGDTYTDPFCIHQYDVDYTSYNWLYTAITRAKKLDQVHLIDPEAQRVIEDFDCDVHWRTYFQ